MQILKRARRNEVAQLGFTNAHIDASTVPDTVCLTYSEVTMATVEKLIEAINEVEDEYYKLDSRSSSKFMDIGSGLGFVVYQVAFAIKCQAVGIEYDQHKLELADTNIR